MVFFFRTVDNGIKLSSLLSIPDVTDVHTINKITSDELNRLVTHEGSPKASQPLGHLLSKIFQSFTVPLPDVFSLKIPFGKILYRNQRINEKFSGTSPDTLVPLYDTEAKAWNWALPVGPPKNASSSRSGADSEGKSEGDDMQKATHKEIFAAFLNALAGCLAASQPKLVEMCFATSTWSAASAQKALPGSDIKRKPDLVLSDDILAKWGNIRVSAELTHSRYRPAMRLGKAADTHAYIMMSEQPWRCFALILSFTDEYRHLRVLMYDHSGGAVSPRFDIYKQPDIFSHIIAAINFGSLENAPARPSTTDCTVAVFTSSLPFPEDPDGVSSSDALESVVTSDSSDSDSTEEGPSGSATHYSMDEEHFPPPSLPVHPTATRSAPLLSLASQMPQAEMTKSIYSVTPLPSQFPYSARSPEPCGKICVGQKVYTIRRIIFASQGLVVRGTICYLATLDDEDYIIKDHWVVGKDDNVVLNEIKMLELMDGLPGVPKLVDHWVVEQSDGDPDVTLKYRQKERRSTRGTSRTHVRLVLKPCGRPLHMFQTLKEFVRALRDIIKIQQAAVEEHQILHRDCSLNNAMILDEPEGSEGFLIDWEFAVRIALDHKYPIGGTGTVPFMSCRLLNQYAVLQQEVDLESKRKKTAKKKETRGRNSVDKPKTLKSSSDSLALPVSYVIQGYADDLESLFSCSLGLDLGLCAAFKITFFTYPGEEKRLTDQFHLYFKQLIPLAVEWRRVLVDNMIHPVTFDTILAVLNSHLNKLPDDEELVSAVDMLRNDAAILTKRVKGKRIASDPPSVVAPKRQKSHHSDTESDSASGSDA
ncbi:uncharacterized protein F5147DRAFT_777034 [Suillus discolor]|uniref:Fungal-type protein kinase domain-containing protein n=1 Tax=Suillus discolor TaxID=1912936 RepID=A0A9P7F045_9AGAM|nr:uncharacterized protein F5147DRAFT_777034 [Suillus discolor]KAG2100475.1 hypothetical protein F5147DRAFT_777034 [Suillus discolor]